MGARYNSVFNLTPIVSYFRNEKINTISFFDETNQLKQRISYYKTGDVRLKVNFIKDKSLLSKLMKSIEIVDGIITTYYENGKIKNIAVAKEDYLNGLCLGYSNSGELDSVRLFLKNEAQPIYDKAKYKSQFLILKLIADEENNNIGRKNELIENLETLRKTEAEKRHKEEELKYQEEEIKRKQLEVELLAKDKQVSILTIKAKEAEILKSELLANEKRKEIEQLNQQKVINELSIKNKENELIQKNIEAENKQKQIQGLEVEKTLSEENRKQQAFIQKMILSGLVMLAVFLFFLFVNLRKTRKANKIIALQKTEVEKQKEVVDIQNHLIKEKQTEIIESITYAKRLQEAILPPFAFIDSNIKNNFILYKPKDIVAGDFYWAEIKDDKFFIAAADSTGHGVPGAMVSVVCSNALNRTVNEFGITDTGKILDKTRELVLETFAKGNSEVKDGMDISLLCIDKSNNKVYWSGANNPLWYVKSSVTSSAVEKSTDTGLDSARPDIQLIEIKADKQPIGKTEITKPFITHEIASQDGMQFYLFTDGFADQFGGPKGKKFMYKQLENLLISISHESMEIQKQKLEAVFENWKGDLEQVDDVCMIGVRV